MMSQLQEILILINTDGDARELDSLRVDLLDELSMLPVTAIESVSHDDAPPNTRGFDAVGLGQLVVKFGPDMSKKLMDTIRSWFERSTATSIELIVDGETSTLTKLSPISLGKEPFSSCLCRVELQGVNCLGKFPGPLEAAAELAEDSPILELSVCPLSRASELRVPGWLLSAIPACSFRGPER
jgi:hypothetical protein